MATLAEAQSIGRQKLTSSLSADVDVQALLCHVMDCESSRLYLSPEQVMSDEQWQKFTQFIERRQQGEPVAHITGSRGFWSLDLAVNRSTLIPRADTELLVALALEKLQPEMTVIDLGTGTGAIALSIAKEIENIKVFATDSQSDAIQLAKKNAAQNALSSVSFIQASWLNAFQTQSFDMVISNPPYIEYDDPHLQQGDVKFEPLTALVSGDDGLDDIRVITRQSRACLKSNGWLIIEHGHEQSQQVQRLFKQAGFTNISAHSDFGGHNRAVMGQLTL
ncbi:hypothetical protein LCGC14_0818720 [marine sediment metagenome]|uniref:Uncharacterized protein n=1 Tax=marine sediment metagenome TaxID=412755 RepID=A0A0F9S4J1_9ZZZZ